MQLSTFCIEERIVPLHRKSDFIYFMKLGTILILLMICAVIANTFEIKTELEYFYIKILQLEYKY